MDAVTFRDILLAQCRLKPHLATTPFRNYGVLDQELGHGLKVWVKHENHLPTNSFKVRNGLSVLTLLSAEARARGVVAATRGNHGLGLAHAGKAFGVPVVICVPRGNNPEKNEAMKALGAELIEDGADYDEAIKIADRLVSERNLTLVHSTNNREVIAGAGTFSLEMLQEQPELDALVLAVGGGSQVAGAVTVAASLSPKIEIYGVQAARASATHDSWHAGEPRTTATADTIADGLATRSCYEMTFPTMQKGLKGFVTVEEDEIGAAMRRLLRTTHNIAEGAGAAGLAGLSKLAPQLAGKRVGIAISGGNLDADSLRWAWSCK
ncbi:MAG: threonine/serine dehydratase [Planctomycetota bacterium]